MKTLKYLFLVVMMFFSNELFSQAPSLINYQAVVRDVNGMPLNNQDISLEIKIYDSFSDTVFCETHYDLNTGNTGLVNLQIGAGNNNCELLNEIDWSAGDYFLQIAIDPENGQNFTFLGAQKLVSVPYALYAENAGNVDDDDADPVNELQTLTINGDTIFISDGNSVVISNNHHWEISSGNIFNTNPGNVGINKENPNHLLDINGDVNIEGLPHKNNIPIVIVVPNGPHSIQQGIDSLPIEGGTVFIKSGTYNLNEGIHINRSNVSILGEQGVKIRLADGVNQPVLLVGTDLETPGANDTIFNITIRDLEIDGNRSNQSSELHPLKPWIRNNGIDVRMVQNMWVQNVNIHNAISGGLVVVHSKKMFVSDSYFHQNEFDGIALYTSSDLQISNVNCSNNQAAGISLDNNLSYVNFDGGFVKDNETVGIFVRNSNNLRFSNLTISGNGEDGCFAASDDDQNGVTRLFFQGCSFLNNGRFGFWMASPASQSPQNTVSSCLFSENIDIGSESTCSGIEISPSGVLFLSANVCQ